MALTAARRAQSAAIQARIAPLHAMKLTSAEIGERIGLSSKTVGNQLYLMGLKAHVAPRSKYAPASNVVDLRDPAPSDRPRAAVNTPIMSAAERAGWEARRRNLIRAMGNNPTPEQREELADIVLRLDRDDAARAARRAVA